MKHSFKIASLLMTSIALSACSSGTPSKRTITIEPAEEAKRVFSKSATGNQDAGAVVSNGGTLVARKATTGNSLLDYSGNTTEVLARGTTGFELRQNSTGELTMVIDGVEHAFAPGDRFVEMDGTVYGYEVNDAGNDRYYSLWSQSGEIDDLKSDGNGYAEVFGYQTNIVRGGAENNAGYVVVGTETRDADLAALPTATYNGYGRINVRPQSGFQSNSQSRDRIRGDLSMTADFSAGNISGKLDNLTIQEAGSDLREDEAGSILLNQTTFDNNGFAGTVGVDETLAASGVSQLDAAYSGAFYGPSAEEVGGVIGGTMVTDGSAQTADGFFFGRKNSE